MLGFAEFWAFMGYVLTILTGLLCVVYGILNWNKPKTGVEKEVEEEITWEKKDSEVIK